MKRVTKALALMGVVGVGAMHANVTIPLRNFHNNATFRDAIDPESYVETLVGNRIEFHAFKPGTYAPSSAGNRVLSTVLGRVHKQSGAISLSPDVVLYLVASAVAEHVAASGETYRGLFTTKASGQETIMIEKSALRQGADDNDWSSVLPEFFKKLGTRMQASGLHQVFEHNFSTSTSLDKACGAVALMKAAENFVQGEVWSRGMGMNLEVPAIASVKLRGTQADWQNLAGKIATLAAQFPAMNGYFNQVQGIAQKCVESFVSADPAFWQDMYGEGNSGWMRTLLNATSGEMTSTEFSWGIGNTMKFVCGVLSYDTDEEGFLEPSLGYAVVGPY